MAEGKWWLACVLHLSLDESHVKLTFLHPSGPSSLFKYLLTEHIETVPIKNILTTVDARTRTGRVYMLSKKESKTASEKLNN